LSGTAATFSFRGAKGKPLAVQALSREFGLLVGTSSGANVVAALELKPIDDGAWSAVIDRMLAAVTPKGNTP